MNIFHFLALICITHADLVTQNEAVVTRQIVSRTNDGNRRPATFHRDQYERARRILSAFVLEANLHSEVYSKFQALLGRINAWAEEHAAKGGYSMNSLHELMEICMRGSEDLERLRDYRQREGVGDISGEPLGLVAVLPAAVATMAVPQRSRVLSLLSTIAPEHRDTIRQFALYLRVFSAKPWKPVHLKSFERPRDGDLSQEIAALIADADESKVSCESVENTDDVSQITRGLVAALRAALFYGSCPGASVELSEPVFDRFAQWAAHVSIPKVRLEVVRPLQSLRNELQSMCAIVPKSSRHLLRLVTRAVNEKREVEEIASKLSKQARNDQDRLCIPIILSPLILVSSFPRLSSLAETTMPLAPETFRSLLYLSFASLQGGLDYSMLAEQLDHDQSMYHDDSFYSRISENLNEFYHLTDAPTLTGLDDSKWGDAYAVNVKKGIKALTWSGELPKKLGGIDKAIAETAHGFSRNRHTRPTRIAIDYWHALNRYIIPAHTPFQARQQARPLAQYRHSVSLQFYSLAAAHQVVDKQSMRDLDRLDALMAYETLKIAMACDTPGCENARRLNERREGRVLLQLLAEESNGADRLDLLNGLLRLKDVMLIVKDRLAAPSMAAPGQSFHSIQSGLPPSTEPDTSAKDGFIDQVISKASDYEYLKTSAVLFFDIANQRISVDARKHRPAAMLMAYLNNEQPLRDQILVSLCTGQTKKEFFQFATKLAIRPFIPQFVIDHVKRNWHGDSLEQVKFDKTQYNHDSLLMGLIKKEVFEQARSK